MPPPFSSLVPAAAQLNGLDNNNNNPARAPRPDRPLHFFDLPQEVRDAVYGNLLKTSVVRFRKRSQYTPQESGEETFALHRCPWDLDPTILLVCRQLYREASLVFYNSNVFVRVALFTPVVQFAEILLQEIAANVDFHGTRPELIEQCSQHAADVNISINQSPMKRSQFIMPQTSLSSLVTFLSTLCNVPNPDYVPFSNIHIDIQYTYGLGHDVSKHLLLEPWRKIHNIPTVSIKWPTGPQQYVDELRDDMTRKAFDTEAWLKSATNLRANGNKAFENGMLENSILYFEQALTSIKSAYRNVPRSGRSALVAQGSDFAKAVSRIRFDCEINISMAWVNLEDCFEQSRKAALNAYRISQNDGPEREILHDPPNDAAWFTDADRASAMFCYGSAAMALGAFEDARNNFEEAQRLNPYDPGISRAVDQARRRLAQEVV